MKKATRPSPVRFTQNDLNADQCGAPARSADAPRSGASLVQKTIMTRIATRDPLACEQHDRSARVGPGIRDEIGAREPRAEQAATRASSFAPRGSLATGGSACGNEITSETARS